MATHLGKILRSIGLVFSMTFIAALFSYATRVIVARKLGPEQYGLFSAVLTFILFFLFFRDLGLGSALVNFIAKFRVENKYNEIKTAIVSVFCLQLVSSSIIGILIIIFSGYLSTHYFKVPESKIILLILVVYTMTSFLYVITKMLFNGFQESIPYSLMEPAKNLFILLLTIILFHYNLGILAAAIPYALVCIVLFVLFQPFIQGKLYFFKHKVVHFKEMSRDLLLFGLPLMAADVGGKIIAYTDTIMLTHFSSLSEVGIYNVVLPTSLFFIHVSRAISAIVFPISTELSFKKDFKNLAKGISLLHKYTLALIIPLIFILFAFADHYLLVFFGKEYVVGTLAFRILLVGSMFFIVASVNNIIISSMGQPKTVTKIILISALLNVVLNLFTIPSFGINGAAIATSSAYLLALILSTHTLIKSVGVPSPYLHWLKLCLSAAVFVMVVFYVTKIFQYSIYVEIILAFVFASLIYVLLLYLFNIIDFTELKITLLKVFKK